MLKVTRFALPLVVILVAISLQSAASAEQTEPIQTRAREDFFNSMSELSDGFAAAGLMAEAEAAAALPQCAVPSSTFVDSWGAPRSGHTHIGVDMMADFDTPVLAPVSGTYEQHGSESFYLHGDDGTLWFGTHLGGHIAASGPVTKGQEVALVSNTGNASGGSPHLHLQYASDGANYENPYPVMYEACLAPPPPTERAVPDVERVYYEAPQPVYVFGTLEVHRWVNSTLPRPERINRFQAVQVRRYFNAVTRAAIIRYLQAISIPYEANWDRVAECESGGNWYINTGNGYYGGLQFNYNTWQAYGGTGYPHQHSKRTQITVAERLRADRGMSPWPHCGDYW